MRVAAIVSCLLLSFALGATPALAENYLIDVKGAHAFIEFRIKHLGYSWLYGPCNRFDGQFSYDEKEPAKSNIAVTIDTASIDSNHAERDKHLRGSDFLNVAKHPQARYNSTAFEELGGGRALLKGNLSLNGHTRPIEIAMEHIGHGPDPTTTLGTPRWRMAS